MDVSGVEFNARDHVHADFHRQVDQTKTHHARIERGDQDSDQDSGGSSESHFRPSAAAQGADHANNTGTYQVTQIQIFSAAALVLLAQTGASSPSQSHSASTDLATQTAPVTGSSANASARVAAVVSQTVPPAVAQPALQSTATSAPSASSLNTVGPTTSATQDPLQAFNAALKSLGLNDQQISAFDQVANLINTVSPAIFSDLVGQLQNLAQQATPASQSVTAPPASTGATPPASATTSGGYQITELSIKFSGVDVKGTSGSTSGSGTSAVGAFEFSKFNLSIEEVKISLTDGNGQSSQLASPQPASNGASFTGQTPSPNGIAA